MAAGLRYFPRSLGSHEEQTDARCRVDDGIWPGRMRYNLLQEQDGGGRFQPMSQQSLVQKVDVRMVGRTHVFNDEVFEAG